jgi:hypothetical protein
VAQDIAIIGGSDVCTPTAQTDENFACFYDSNDTPYVGEPFPGTGIATGTVIATTRFLLSYDFAVTANITLGARVGYAIGGGPAAGQAVSGEGADPVAYEDDTYSGGTPFLPFHAEARGAYWFGKNAMGKKGLRPYIALGGGMAQVDAKVGVNIKDCTGHEVGTASMPGAAHASAGNPSSPDPEQACQDALTNFDQRNMPDVKLNAYKKLGQGFITVAGGAAFAFSESMAVQLNLNFMYMLPSSGPVIEPSLGFTLGL